MAERKRERNASQCIDIYEPMLLGNRGCITSNMIILIKLKSKCIRYPLNGVLTEHFTKKYSNVNFSFTLDNNKKLN